MSAGPAPATRFALALLVGLAAFSGWLVFRQRESEPEPGAPVMPRDLHVNAPADVWPGAGADRVAVPGLEDPRSAGTAGASVADAAPRVQVETVTLFARVTDRDGIALGNASVTVVVTRRASGQRMRIESSVTDAAGEASVRFQVAEGCDALISAGKEGFVPWSNRVAAEDLSGVHAVSIALEPSRIVAVAGALLRPGGAAFSPADVARVLGEVEGAPAVVQGGAASAATGVFAVEGTEPDWSGARPLRAAAIEPADGTFRFELRGGFDGWLGVLRGGEVLASRRYREGDGAVTFTLDA